MATNMGGRSLPNESEINPKSAAEQKAITLGERCLCLYHPERKLDARTSIERTESQTHISIKVTVSCPECGTAGVEDNRVTRSWFTDKPDDVVNTWQSVEHREFILMHLAAVGRNLLLARQQS